MKLRSLASWLLVAAFAAVGVGVRAADAPAKPTANAPAVAKPDKPAPADVQQAIDQFGAKRDTMIANRQALLDQLKNATAEQKKAILDQMQAQQKDLLDAQRALGRQIRDELRKLRQSQPAGGNR
jgi:hypothetical protein